MVPWAHMSQPPNDISISSLVFAQHTRVHNTQTDILTTLRVTSAAIGPVYAMHVMRPSNYNYQYYQFSFYFQLLK